MGTGGVLKSLNILHKAMLAGQILFSAVCGYLVYAGIISPSAKELDKVLQVVAIALSVAGVFAGMSVFKKRLLQIRDMQTGINEKFSAYRSACIIQWALLEGPVIFIIISFFLTGNYAFPALAIVLIFLFALQAPSKLKIALQLQVSEAELEDL